MSLGYAQKLSFKEDVGAVGMTELFDPPEILQQKIKNLAAIIHESKHLVAFTGAGISTSCGIPDFRGPKGVWTLQREGRGVPEASLPFHSAVPSLTHMALVELERLGILKFVISQNVDCLHLRSGIPREKLAELHGNSFRELCLSCGTEYIRDFEVETIGLKQTSRHCSGINCKVKLTDTVLDWEDALPRKEMNAAEKHCKAANLVLCLGTSLQITPACNLPLKCIRGGGKIVIVNLQQTPKDKKANLVIHGLVDKVMAGVMNLLNFRIPPYVRIDLIQICLSHSQRRRTYVDWRLGIVSAHGSKAPLPFVKSVEVSFPDKPGLKYALLTKQPFHLRRRTMRTNPFKFALKINLGEGCGCTDINIPWEVNFQVKQKGFRHDKTMIFQKLKDDAIRQSCCGQSAIVEKTISPTEETCLYACVTNLHFYNTSLNAEDSEAKSDVNGDVKKTLEEENGECIPPKNESLTAGCLKGDVNASDTADADDAERYQDSGKDEERSLKKLKTT